MRTHRWLVAKPADYSRLDQRRTKTPQRPCRPSPSNSRWEHHRSRGDSHRAAASVFPRHESEAGVTRASDVVRQKCSPAEAGVRKAAVRLKPDTTSDL